MNQARQVGERFDERAKQYDNPVTSYIGERELRAIRTMVAPQIDVLDYGCGTWRTTLDLLARGCNVTAYDISAEMLARAEFKAKQKGFIAQFTADESALEGRKWPVVTCIGVLDYYNDPIPLLQTLNSYIESAGTLVVTYPNGLSPLGWIYALTSRFTVRSHVKTPSAVRRAAEQVGLRVFSLKYAFPALSPIGHTLVVGMVPENKGSSDLLADPGEHLSR
jgi:2-polyprenyl-3-methyl-5-hydroxy-6-metoxy-1,4-benzoquinol methylase